MHICPSNDNVSTVVRNECSSAFKKLGTSLLRTALVHVSAGLCCRDSPPFLSIQGLLTKLITVASNLYQCHLGNTSICVFRSSRALPWISDVVCRLLKLCMKIFQSLKWDAFQSIVTCSSWKFCFFQWKCDGCYLYMFRKIPSLYIHPFYSTLNLLDNE